MMVWPATSSAQTPACPPHVRCHPEQRPPPRNEQEARRRMETEEAASIEAAIRQRESDAIRQSEAGSVDAERRAAWIDRGRQKEPPPVRLQTPLFTVTPSGRIVGGSGETFELGLSTGLRVDGIALEAGRLAFELEAVVGSRNSEKMEAGTFAGELSVLWIGERTALPFVRVGTSLGSFVSGPAGGTPSGFYRLFVGIGVDNYFVPLGAGRGAGFSVEMRGGLFDGYGGDGGALSRVRAEAQVLMGPRFAF